MLDKIPQQCNCSGAGEPLSKTDAEDQLGIKKGHGRNYLEFDVDVNKVDIRKNPDTGQWEYSMKGDVEINPDNAKFVKRK